MERFIKCLVSSRARKGNYHSSESSTLFGGGQVIGYIVREINQAGRYAITGYSGLAWSEHQFKDNDVIDVRTVDAGDSVTFSKDTKVLVGNEFKLIKRGQSYIYPQDKAEILGDPSTCGKINQEDIIRMEMAQIANQQSAVVAVAAAPNDELARQLAVSEAKQAETARQLAAALDAAPAVAPFEVTAKPEAEVNTTPLAEATEEVADNAEELPVTN